MNTLFNKKPILMIIRIEKNNKFCLKCYLYKLYMSTEKLINENSKILTNTKFDPNGSEKKFSDPQISNLNLNKVKNNIIKKKKIKTCINTLQETLRKKEVKKQFENRILYGLFISVVAVLFYVST